MRRLFLIGMLFCCTVWLYGERIVLKTGKTVYGTIMAQTDDVLMVQTRDGARYQFLRNDILSIDEETLTDTVAVVTTTTNETRPVALRVSVSGGAALCPQEAAGGMVTAEVQIGTRTLAGKNLFLGASVGYSGAFLHPAAHFIPLQAVVACPIPLSANGNCPEIGFSLGYSFAARSGHGGMTGALSAGYRMLFNGTTSLTIGGIARFQQTARERTETIDDIGYAHSVGTMLWLAGGQIILQF